MRADTQAVTEALASAVAAAGLAPSIHDTRPWRWRMTDNGLDLHLESSRLSDVTEPDVRLATLSCGAALHHARVSLAAQGWRATETRMPDPARPEHLARLQVDGPAPAPVEALTVRRTNRRPPPGRRIGPDELAAIITAVHAEGSLLHVLYPNQAELASWTGVTRSTGTGSRHDRSALLAIRYKRGEQPMNWLRAGEALSAAWLTAAEIGVSLLPLSANVTYPYVVLHLSSIDLPINRIP
ncbi:nitroreductase [Phytohabitans rumicis]|nr:nitroreductase [Phytohabitans rumicis]